MSNHTTNSITPGRVRKFPPGVSYTQHAFVDDDDFDTIENDFDENYPIIRDVSLQSQQPRRSSVQFTNNNKSTGAYYTPQIKRKHIQDQVTNCSSDSFKDQMDILQNMLKEVNRKIDIVNKKEELFEKKLEHMDKQLGGIIRKVNKYPKWSEPPKEIPIIKYNDRNLLLAPIDPTPGGLMKNLINQLFTKQEIMDGVHEQVNERTLIIQEAIQAYFFYDDQYKIDGFWNGEGKIIRGNQRRGHTFRNKQSAQNQMKTNTRTAHSDND